MHLGTVIAIPVTSPSPPGLTRSDRQVPGGPVRDSKGLAVQSTGRPTERPKKSYEEVHGKARFGV